MSPDAQKQLELDPKSIEKATNMLMHIDLQQIEENDPMTKGPEIDY